MAISKDKTPIYKQKIIACLKEHGKLAKSRINFLCRMNLYDTYFLLQEMELEGTIKKVKGLIPLYDLEVKNGA